MTSYPTFSKLSTTSNSSPQLQRTAPVLDFRCLFTRDVQRKKKRWQDGRLKLHTFNKRIMVHDEGSNFVGDSYWQNDEELEEGEELNLEQNGIIVQVGEFMGKRDQDLDELVDKRLRIREKRALAKLVSGSISGLSLTIEKNRDESNQGYQKSFNAATPIGQIKNIVNSKRLPLEKQKVHENDSVKGKDGRGFSIKRQRRDFSPPSKSTYAQNLIGAKVYLTSKNTSRSKLNSSLPVKAGSTNPNSSRTTIDLTKDDKNSLLKIKNIKDINKPKPNDQKNFALAIDNSNKSFTSNLTRATPTILDPVHTSKEPINTESVIARRFPWVEDPKSNFSTASTKITIPAYEEEVLNNTSLKPIPHNIIEETEDVFYSSKHTLENSSIIRKNKIHSEIQPRTATQKLNPSSGQSSSPTVSEVTINLDNSDIECNAISSDNLSPKYVQNQSNNTLRLKTRPRRKMIFMESTLDNGVRFNQVEQNQYEILVSKVQNKKAKTSQCKTVNIEVSSTSAQSKQKNPFNKCESNLTYDHSDNEQRDYLPNEDSEKKISNSKASKKSSLTPRNQCNNQKSTNYKDSRPEQNIQVEELKHSTLDLLRVEAKRGNLNKNNQQVVKGRSLNTNTLEATKSFPKTLLLNPATRGIPLHTVTASTVDALNFWGDITSPSSRTLNKMEELLYGDNPSNSIAVENSSSDLGPWSRESFDLFGITKPP